MTTAVAQAGATSIDYLGMSDEDFLNATAPGAEVAEPAEAGAVIEGKFSPKYTPADQGEGAKSSEESGAAGDDAGGGDKAEVKEEEEEAKTEQTTTPADAATAVTAEVKPVEAVAANAAEGDKAAGSEEPKPVDYQAFYKQIMTPFKANGKTFEPKTPEEAIRLMQMGAGYGRKIQDLQPHLKVLRMLEKNDLLDQDKLSFLIDINSNNKDAIIKKIKDSGIDPLDLNITDNVSYNPTNHAVSDNELNLHQAIQNLQSEPSGREFITIVNQTWDETSKSVLWDKPELLEIIQSQRETGIYDQIAAEVDRQKILGKIPASTPFLKAYELAGNHLRDTNGFTFTDEQLAKIQTQPAQQQTVSQPQVIATRAEVPKSQVQNGDKAAAASPTVVSGAAKAAPVNPLSMADDVFMKEFAGRF